MSDSETHNLTSLCELRTDEPADLASCLFLSIMPNEYTAPLLICVFVLLILFSYFINGATLFRLNHSNDLSWEPRRTLLKNLILNNIMQSTNFGTAVIHSLLLRRTVVLNSWCLAQYFLSTVNVLSRLFIITCMALERYLYVCQVTHYILITKPVHLRLAQVLIWVYSITVSVCSIILLYAWRQEHEEGSRGLLCEPDTIEQLMGSPRPAAVFRICVGSSTLLLCLLCNAFAYRGIYRDPSKLTQPFDKVNAAARNSVLFYSGMLFLQLLPLLFKVISDALWEAEGTGASTTPSSTAAVIMHLSLLVMPMVPPCINPLLHSLRNRETRRALLDLVRCPERVAVDAQFTLENVGREHRAQEG